MDRSGLALAKAAALDHGRLARLETAVATPLQNPSALTAARIVSALCRSPLHTATQYALLTALASAGRTVFASGTGFVVDAIGWPAFFIATTAAALPSLALLAWLQRRGHFAPLDAARNESK